MTAGNRGYVKGAAGKLRAAGVALQPVTAESKFLSLMLKTLMLVVLLTVMAAQSSATIFNDRDAQFSWTTDTQTGLDWLDFSFSNSLLMDTILPPVHVSTVGRPFEDVVAELEPGGDYAGWRIATDDRILTFLTHIANQYGGSLDGRILALTAPYTGLTYADPSLYADLYAIDGYTAQPPCHDEEECILTSFELIWGLLVDLMPTYAYYGEGNFAYYSEYLDEFISSPEAETGTWLIRDTPHAVPIPATVWLFGSGLLGLIGLSRRKKAA